MALIEKIDREDILLYDLLKHPVLGTEFIYNVDKLEYEKPFIWSDYQQEFLCDFANYVSMACARAIGKSEALTALIFWALILNLFPNDYIIYTVPNKVHLEPVFNKLIRSFRSNSLLKNFIEPRGGINNSDFTIRLLNNALLMCRIAGQSGTGANVIGLHAPLEILDESGYYPWGTWLELQPTLNTFTDGFRQIVSGVPTGLREKNVCYHADMENSSFSKHRISALKNPRFSEEDRQRAIEQYGGEDTDDYIHMVLGEHGKPVYALFDRSLFEISKYNVYKLVINGQEIGDNLTLYMNKLSMMPNIEEGHVNVFFGIDLGYSEPSAIIIFYTDTHGRIKIHGRIKLLSVSLGLQDRLIDYLDSRFKPTLIGIDAGGLGKGPVQRLLDADEFTHKDYDKRLIPIVFNQDIIIGKSADGEDVKNKAKALSVTVLQEYSNNHKIVYSYSDLEFISELERMTFVRNPSGDIVYRTLTDRGGKRGEDHFTSAALCGVLAYYLRNESLNLYKSRTKLASPSWFMG